MSKFEVSVKNAAEFHGNCDESFVITIENRAGRKWFSNTIHSCPGNAAESALVLSEMINDGFKLNNKEWTETEDSQLDTMIKQQTQEAIERASGLS